MLALKILDSAADLQVVCCAVVSSQVKAAIVIGQLIFT